jgi:hypothetical protein
MLVQLLVLFWFPRATVPLAVLCQLHSLYDCDHKTLTPEITF